MTPHKKKWCAATVATTTMPLGVSFDTVTSNMTGELENIHHVPNGSTDPPPRTISSMTGSPNGSTEAPPRTISSMTGSSVDKDAMFSEFKNRLEAEQEQDNFDTFDIQAWLVGEAIYTTSIIKVLICCIFAILFFAIRMTLLVLLGLGALCTEKLTNTGGRSVVGGGMDGTEEWTKSIIYFCLIIISLRLASEIISDSDMAVPSQECLRLANKDTATKYGKRSCIVQFFRRYLLIVMQCTAIARRFYIPVFAMIAAIQTMRYNDPDDAKYGAMYTHPSTLLLNTLAVMFVLEMDEKTCALFVCKAKKAAITKQLNKLLTTRPWRKVKAHERDKWGLRVHKTCCGLNWRIDNYCEVYVEGLNLINRVTTLACVALLFWGFLSGEEGGVVEIYFDWFSAKEHISSKEIISIIKNGTCYDLDGLCSCTCDDLEVSCSCESSCGTDENKYNCAETCDSCNSAEYAKASTDLYCDVYWGSSFWLGLFGVAICFVSYAIFIMIIGAKSRITKKLAQLFTAFSGLSLGFSVLIVALGIAWGRGGLQEQEEIAFLVNIAFPIGTAAGIASTLMATNFVDYDQQRQDKEIAMSTNAREESMENGDTRNT